MATATAAAGIGVKSSGFGRAVTAAAHREVWCGQREVVEPAVGNVRAGTRRQPSGSTSPESERPVIEGDSVEVAGYRRQRRPHPGRQSLPAELPRVEKVIACPAEQCVCGQCGQPTTVIGYEESEQSEVEPAKYFVLVSKREKRTCRCCKGGRIVSAPAPVRIIDKGLVSDRVVIDTVIRKYCDHLPLYRCTGRV